MMTKFEKNITKDNCSVTAHPSMMTKLMTPDVQGEKLTHLKKKDIIYVLKQHESIPVYIHMHWIYKYKTILTVNQAGRCLPPRWSDRQVTSFRRIFSRSIHLPVNFKISFILLTE